MRLSELIRLQHNKFIEDLAFWSQIARKQSPVLELGCGHGRVALELVQSGFEVIGVEVDPEPLLYLKSQISRLPAEVRARIRIFEADFLDFIPPRPVGSVIIPCNTLSTVSRENRRMVIGNSYQLLQPEGIFCASLPNPAWLEEIHLELEKYPDGIGELEHETSMFIPEGEIPVEISSRFLSKPGALGWEWIYDCLLPDGRVNRFSHRTLHYLDSADTYQRELRKVGFHSIQTLGDFQGGKFSDQSPYLILCAQR